MRLLRYCYAIALLLFYSLQQSYAQGQNPTGELQTFIPSKAEMKDYTPRIPKSWTREGNDTTEPKVSREVLAFFTGAKMIIKAGGVRHALRGNTSKSDYYEYNNTFSGDGYRITTRDLDEKKLEGGAGTYFQHIELTIQHGGKTTKLQMRGLYYQGT